MSTGEQSGQGAGAGGGGVEWWWFGSTVSAGKWEVAEGRESGRGKWQGCKQVSKWEAEGRESGLNEA